MKKGMVLPFEPHSITIDEVTYSIDMPQVSREDGIFLWCDAIHKQDNFLYYVEIFMKWKFKELLKIDWCFWRAWVVLSGPVSLQLWWVLVVQEKWLWSGRKTGGYIKGDIKISGYPKKQETFFFFFTMSKMTFTLHKLPFMNPYSIQLGVRKLPLLWQIPHSHLVDSGA